MRPKSTTSDIPGTHDVKAHIHNKFVKHMKVLKEDITVNNFTMDSRLCYLPETRIDGTRKSFDYRGWLVC